MRVSLEERKLVSRKNVSHHSHVYCISGKNNLIFSRACRQCAYAGSGNCGSVDNTRFRVIERGLKTCGLRERMTHWHAERVRESINVDLSW